ncbi:membrane protein [Defluviimonas sp. 20V17]|uniref:DUF475 domain-containing protein n=1 Tax=Allgaiera indica TaxID=765699 RepID=A0AAN4UR62_9RHOB|nr:DUF475 domain-containing protein [Allgaiera indica]KDB02903.1 membrane protein [Defluviimonas sp. 20V17]GHE01518.1 hypothetical protein GCM10008024_17310 [Allgaiera indica]SDW88138.1 hypothetical protein SAMN05444006_107193 [Allgaiera indica]
MQSARVQFRTAFAATAVGLCLAFWLGWQASHSLGGALSALAVGVVLAVLEISLSFDNAIVNAGKLKQMSPVWQRRFMTWGILIAVFGMRVLLPLLVVAVAAHLSPVAALRLAAAEPQAYARIMEEAHLSIAAFGGTFLMLVGLRYFMDEHKQVDWISRLECRLRDCARVRGLEIAFVLVVVLAVAWALPHRVAGDFLFAALLGMLVFTGVELLGHVLDAGAAARGAAAVGGLGAFLYLEVLDASFSFDGVVGAFALTQNLFLIAIGLGTGAFYVRALTVTLVERETLARFRYLEHGAFYSILALAVIMYAQTLVEISELVTGGLGAGFIGLSLLSSVRYNRRIAHARSAGAEVSREA